MDKNGKVANEILALPYMSFFSPEFNFTLSEWLIEKNCF